MIERSAFRPPPSVTQRSRPTPGIRARFNEVATRGDLQLVVAVSLIGLLIALNLMFRFPEYGAIIAQYNQF